METYYYKQIDRESGEVVGFISYNGREPTNDNERILLVEITREEFESIISSLLQEDVPEEEVEESAD